jgi:hypothetical protein
MNKREIILTSVLLLTIILGMFVYTYIAKKASLTVTEIDYQMVYHIKVGAIV